jgi:hypothetical protein
MLQAIARQAAMPPAIGRQVAMPPAIGRRAVIPRSKDQGVDIDHRSSIQALDSARHSMARAAASLAHHRGMAAVVAAAVDRISRETTVRAAGKLLALSRKV